MHRFSVPTPLWLLLAATLVRCGGGSAAPAPVAAPVAAATVTITLENATVNELDTVALTVVGLGSAPGTVLWSVDGIPGGDPAVGTIPGSGVSAVYTAPAGPGAHQITAASQADPGSSAEAGLQVQGPAMAVALSPPNAQLAPGGVLALAGSVLNSGHLGLAWAVDGVPGGSAAVGILAGTGSTCTYTAPATAGSHLVTAASLADPAVSATSTVTVTVPQPAPAPAPAPTPAPAPDAVTLAWTGNGSVNVSGSVLLTASVGGVAGAPVDWSVDGLAGGSATTGTILGSGAWVVYLAPPAAGSHGVTATNPADPTQSATLTCTVVGAPATAANPAIVVNVKAAPYNAQGNGVSDDTAAIQAAINAVAGTGGTVQIPDGTYMINAAAANGEDGLLLRSGMTLSLTAGAVLQALPNALQTYYLLYLYGVHDVNILGGTVAGDLAGHLGTLGEWGMGIGVDGGSANVVVAGLRVTQCWGDGIYVTGGSTGVTVCSVVSDGNRRQGMSIVNADGVVVRDSAFQNTAGTAPQNGIDIEPAPGQSVNAAQIFNCTFSANAGGGLQSGPDNGTMSSASFTQSAICYNTFTGNAAWGVEMQDCAGNIIIGNVIGTTAGNGIMVQFAVTGATVSGNTVTGSSGDGIFLAECHGVTVSGNTVTGNAGYGIQNQAGAGATLTGNTDTGNTLGP